LTVKLLVAAVLLSMVVLPIAVMMTKVTGADFRNVLENPRFKGALVNSAVYTAIATVIVVLLAYGLALSTARVNIRGKRLFSIILVLPMLIPSISHGKGLMLLLGQNGVLTRLLGLSHGIHGGLGIVLGSVLYAFPVAYIMLADVLNYEDMSVYEAAQILGISPMRAFFRISLPYLKKPLIAATFSTFSLIVTDYGVPSMIGGKKNTLALLMYQETEGTIGQRAVYGVFLLVPAIVAFCVDMIGKERASSSYVPKTTVGSNRPLHKILAYSLCVLTAIVALLPILVFILLSVIRNYPYDLTVTAEHFLNVFGEGQYLINSLVVALFTALLGVLIGFVTAYLTSRMRSPFSRVLHLLAICSMAIPGLVLGISYLMTFTGSFLYGSVLILIMVNTAHFLSSPYLMMYNSFGKMNENLEAVGSTLGIGRVRMLGRVFLPQSLGTMVEMFSYLFVNSMMTISAVAFLANTSNKPISLMITQYEEQGGQKGNIAVVSLLILVVNVIVKIIAERIKTVSARKKA